MYPILRRIKAEKSPHSPNTSIGTELSEKSSAFETPKKEENFDSDLADPIKNSIVLAWLEKVRVSCSGEQENYGRLMKLRNKALTLPESEKEKIGSVLSILQKIFGKPYRYYEELEQSVKKTIQQLR